MMRTVTIRELLAFEEGRAAFVTGILFSDGDGVKLCEAIGESFPLSCLGDQVTVTDLDVLVEADTMLVENGGVMTSVGEVVLPGFYESGVFRVDPTAGSPDTGV